MASISKSWLGWRKRSLELIVSVDESDGIFRISLGQIFQMFLMFPLLGTAHLMPQLGRAPEDTACNPSSASAYPHCTNHSASLC